MKNQIEKILQAWAKLSVFALASLVMVFGALAHASDEESPAKPAVVKANAKSSEKKASHHRHEKKATEDGLDEGEKMDQYGQVENDFMKRATKKQLLALDVEWKKTAPPVTPFTINPTPDLSWTDDAHPERDSWTEYLIAVVNSVFDDLDQAKDIKAFCPKYAKLTRDQKVTVWAQLFTSISYWESSYDPTNRTKETMADRGIDDITHMSVYSEGLLQLSYQDVTQGDDSYFPACKFDWENDRKMSYSNPLRSILNPYRNLYCGVNLMAMYVTENHDDIVVKDNYYWSTLQTGNTLENRVGQMERMVQDQLPYCGKTKRRPLLDFLLRVTTMFRWLYKLFP